MDGRLEAGRIDRSRQTPRFAAKAHGWVFLGGLAAAGALLLAACGSSGSKAATNPSVPAAAVGSTLPQTAAHASTSGSPNVVLTSVPKYGNILTDSRGFALYLYTADSPARTGCTGACLKYWPPLLLPAGQKTPVGGPGLTGLGTLARPGEIQVTWKGLPLYTFVGDTQPGMVAGQDVKDAGGIWYLASPGAPAPRAATAPASKSPASTAPANAPGGVSQSPATQPPMTQAPNTQPPMTQAPNTQPPMTQAPNTQPPVTQPPVTQPPVTHPPATPPPTTTPPTTAPGGTVSY
jgi:predicted lipoprotein with Yx(FWY)xxD motif